MDSKKQCRKCGQTKSLDEFHKKQGNKDGRHSYCKVCAIKGAKKDYRNRKDVILPRANKFYKTKRQQFQAAVNELKANLTCCMCPESEPCCLDFHHTIKEEKEGCVARFVLSKSASKVVNEINKCVCVCSNCHRKIHAGLLSVDCSQRVKITKKEFDILLEQNMVT